MFFFFFFNDTATTEIYTLSLHDALPISPADAACAPWVRDTRAARCARQRRCAPRPRSPPDCAEQHVRSEEHTSELQSLAYLVCRLLLEKKKKQTLRTHCQRHDLVRRRRY